MVLLNQTSPCQALQVHKLHNNGYYTEEVAPSLVISQYHTTYIPFNISSLKYTLFQLFSNLLIIQPSINNQNSILIKSQFYLTSKVLNNTSDTFAKFNIINENNLNDMQNRKKRGLINYLGSGINFFTGNLDNNDLEVITQNLQTLKFN